MNSIPVFWHVGASRLLSPVLCSESSYWLCQTSCPICPSCWVGQHPEVLISVMTLHGWCGTSGLTPCERVVAADICRIFQIGPYAFISHFFVFSSIGSISSDFQDQSRWSVDKRSWCFHQWTDNHSIGSCGIFSQILTRKLLKRIICVWLTDGPPR